jgi:hypothetical protein
MCNLQHALLAAFALVAAFAQWGRASLLCTDGGRKNRTQLS